MDVIRNRASCCGSFGREVTGHPCEFLVRTLGEISNSPETDTHENEFQHSVTPTVLVEVGCSERANGRRDKTALIRSQGFRRQA